MVVGSNPAGRGRKSHAYACFFLFEYRNTVIRRIFNEILIINISFINYLHMMNNLDNSINILHTAHEKDPDSYEIYRETCRGIITSDGRVLLSHETVDDMWLFPGGGVEPGETNEECCVREISEETGYNVKTVRQIADVHMYFENGKFINHFYVCEIISEGEPHRLDYETELGQSAEWVEINEALRKFGEFEKYRSTERERSIIYEREFLALKNYIEVTGLTICIGTTDRLNLHIIIVRGSGFYRIPQKNASPYYTKFAFCIIRG